MSFWLMFLLPLRLSSCNVSTVMSPIPITSESNSIRMTIHVLKASHVTFLSDPMLLFKFGYETDD